MFIFKLDFNNYFRLMQVLLASVFNLHLLFQVVVESRSSALEYGDLTVEEGSPVNPDLHFDSQLMHLYVMTEKKVSFFMIMSFKNIELMYLQYVGRY